jgi:ABC-type multidrug transport system fused ATPase/permease subunit
MAVAGEGSLVFEDVQVSNSAGKPFLEHARLQIERRSIIAIAGASPEERRLMGELLFGNYAPAAGRLCIGDVAVGEISSDNLAHCIAVAPQKCRLMDGTIAENIRFFRAGYAQAEIERCAKTAGLHEYVTTLPKRYSTLVGPGNLQLQKEFAWRLGVARALLAGPEFLFLDEPDIRLNDELRQAVPAIIAEQRGRRTVVILANQTEWLNAADKVYRLDRGQFREEKGAMVP